MIVNTGTVITLLMKKCTDAHGLTVKEKVAEYISGANGTVVKIMGTTSMTLFLGAQIRAGCGKCCYLLRKLLPKPAEM